MAQLLLAGDTAAKDPLQPICLKAPLCVFFVEGCVGCSSLAEYGICWLFPWSGLRAGRVS